MRTIILNLLVGVSVAGFVAIYKRNADAKLGLPGRVTFWDVVNVLRFHADRHVIVNAMNYAASEAKKRYPYEPEDANGQQNAFKHTCWAAILTSELGDTEARIITSGHECFRGNPRLDNEMDSHNNDVGHKLGLLHPKATWATFANLSQIQVEEGKLLIVNQNRLASSDQPITQPSQRVQRPTRLADAATSVDQPSGLE